MGAPPPRRDLRAERGRFLAPPSFSGWQPELPPSSGIRLIHFSLLLLLPLLLLFRLTARMLPLPLCLLLLLL